VLEADTVDPTGAHRGGFNGAVDAVRRQASAALGSGTAGSAAALVRGFVLGEDDRIDADTVTDFRRSGLAHLLAVSGENVALLALLAAPFLALVGLRLRARLLLLLALIGLYVLVTGASPSIQRAGVMGAASVIATMAGRPRARWHVVLLAAAVTLLLNPRATGDPGWQLSFAAVLGIMFAAAPIRDALLPPSGKAGPLRRALAEGAGVTIAATLATAPLIAVAFDNLSLTSLPANLLALPAVAPVMWLGMAAAAMGQIPLAPVAPLSWLAGVLGAYIAQIAHWLGAPSWAQATLPSVAAPIVAASYVALALGLYLALTARGRRRWLSVRVGALAGAATVIALVGALAPIPDARRPVRQGPEPGLRAFVLDVGQGDAILLKPRRGAPLLVDGGPPGDDLAGKLHALGVERLGAALVTHDQSDHAGGVEALLGSYPMGRLILGVRSARLAREARVAGVPIARTAQGDDIRAGALQLQVLWPPRELESARAARGQDPNLAAIIAVARWHSFSMLLTADAEAESVPVDPGPVDVLKVAHHGSADAGLADLLERSRPRLAVISVGAGNPYGHPDPKTLATLQRHAVPVLRTDLDGTVEIDARRRGWTVTTAK
jgi:competence protein ComEC